MSRPTIHAARRSDRKALVAGGVASAVVHGVLFAVFGFHVVLPAAEEPTVRAAAPADDALRLVALKDAPDLSIDPVSTRPSEDGGGDAASASSVAAGATSASAMDGGPPPAPHAASVPPILLTYAAPVRSPLLIAAGDGRSTPHADAAPQTAADDAAAEARVATYTPGGVRSAKLGWSGQDAVKARRDGGIRASLALGVGDGHCPARPPARGPLGL